FSLSTTNGGRSYLAGRRSPVADRSSSALLVAFRRRSKLAASSSPPPSIGKFDSIIASNSPATPSRGGRNYPVRTCSSSHSSIISIANSKSAFSIY
ncbi:hypothetical protein SOVF_206280, partial [Spinacia oleracea]